MQLRITDANIKVNLRGGLLETFFGYMLVAITNSYISTKTTVVAG